MLIETVEGYDRNVIYPVDDFNIYHPKSAQNDMVNSPSHYTRGSQEAIDIIEKPFKMHLM